MKMTAPTARHDAFYQDAKALLTKYADVPSLELIALASHVLGQTIAMLSPENAADSRLEVLIQRNIVQGRLDQCYDNMRIFDTKGSA